MGNLPREWSQMTPNYISIMSALSVTMEGSYEQGLAYWPALLKHVLMLETCFDA